LRGKDPVKKTSCRAASALSGVESTSGTWFIATGGIRPGEHFPEPAVASSAAASRCGKVRKFLNRFCAQDVDRIANLRLTDTEALADQHGGRATRAPYNSLFHDRAK
jgi:hypothetical protein